VAADLSDLGRGGLSEYVTIPSDDAVGLPETVDFATAASLPTAGVTAYQALETVAHLSSGERVLIDGASGGVGSFTVLIARIIGADFTAVVGPCKVATARSLGASRVIDSLMFQTMLGGKRSRFHTMKPNQADLERPQPTPSSAFEPPPVARDGYICCFSFPVSSPNSIFAPRCSYPPTR
jgi:hypothetical protein